MMLSEDVGAHEMIGHSFYYIMPNVTPRTQTNWTPAFPFHAKPYRFLCNHAGRDMEYS